MDFMHHLLWLCSKNFYNFFWVFIDFLNDSLCPSNITNFRHLMETGQTPWCCSCFIYWFNAFSRSLAWRLFENGVNITSLVIEKLLESFFRKLRIKRSIQTTDTRWIQHRILGFGNLCNSFSGFFQNFNLQLWCISVRVFYLFLVCIDGRTLWSLSLGISSQRRLGLSLALVERFFLIILSSWIDWAGGNNFFRHFPTWNSRWDKAHSTCQNSEFLLILLGENFLVKIFTQAIPTCCSRFLVFLN